MNKLIYLGALTAITLLAGCTGDSPTPSTDITQLQGEYRTNASLDLSCVAITDERQLPQLSITLQTDGSFRLIRTDFSPSKHTTELTNVTVQSKTDTLLIFRDNQKIGSLYLGTWRDFSGKKVREVTAPMLLVSMNDTTSQTYFFFLGYRQ